MLGRFFCRDLKIADPEGPTHRAPFSCQGPHPGKPVPSRIDKHLQGMQTPMRVLYTPDMLQRLIAAISAGKLETADRAMLLVDATALTQAGKLGADQLLRLLAAYSNEKDHLLTVWLVCLAPLAHSSDLRSLCVCARMSTFRDHGLAPQVVSPVSKHACPVHLVLRLKSHDSRTVVCMLWGYGAMVPGDGH